MLGRLARAKAASKTQADGNPAAPLVRLRRRIPPDRRRALRLQKRRMLDDARQLPAAPMPDPTPETVILSILLTDMDRADRRADRPRRLLALQCSCEFMHEQLSGDAFADWADRAAMQRAIEGAYALLARLRRG